MKEVSFMMEHANNWMSRRQLLKLGSTGVLTAGLSFPILQSCKSGDVEKIITGLTKLVTLINNYRTANSLASIPISADLMAVALAHVMDLGSYQPHKTCGTQGNLHSWSEHGSWQGVYGDGAWKGCCYPDDHSNPTCMWDKPKEITNYPSYGYEIAAEGVSTAQDALNSWMKSVPHNDVILNKGIWANRTWKALGAVIGGGYACAWFGES
jgi:hypothetical protein